MSSLDTDAVAPFTAPVAPERPLGRSILRGLNNRCPACGSGRLFRAYVKPVDNCAACGEDISPQRADDLPPYLVIFVLGHVLVGGYMMLDLVYPASAWAYLAVLAPLGVISALASLQPIKGGVIGLQWALKMHGFGGHDDNPGSFEPKNPSA